MANIPNPRADHDEATRADALASFRANRPTFYAVAYNRRTLIGPFPTATAAHDAIADDPSGFHVEQLRSGHDWAVQVNDDGTQTLVQYEVSES